jgi:hypothetical protein
MLKESLKKMPSEFDQLFISLISKQIFDKNELP